MSAVPPRFALTDYRRGADGALVFGAGNKLAGNCRGCCGCIRCALSGVGATGPSARHHVDGPADGSGSEQVVLSLSLHSGAQYRRGRADLHTAPKETALLWRWKRKRQLRLRPSVRRGLPADIADWLDRNARIVLDTTDTIAEIADARDEIVDMLVEHRLSKTYTLYTDPFEGECTLSWKWNRWHGISYSVSAENWRFPSPRRIITEADRLLDWRAPSGVVAKARLTLRF